MTNALNFSVRWYVVVLVAAVLSLIPTALAAQHANSIGAASVGWTIDGKPTAQADLAISAMQQASVHGLRVSDYELTALQTARARLFSADNVAGDVNDFEQRLSRNLLRFLADLHHGRVLAAAVGFHLPHANERLDLPAIVQRLKYEPHMMRAIDALKPQYDGYAQLERALAQYRVLAADTTLPHISPINATVHVREYYADAAKLRAFLHALGDLTDSRVAKSEELTFDDSLSAAVRIFQRRHGMDADGVLTRATVAAMRVTTTARVRQIELSLERWRWLPDTLPARYAIINVPAFRLYLLDNDPHMRAPSVSMNVIVGRADDRHDTPVFTGVMNEVVFRPFWEVPFRIARNELVPAIRRDAKYLNRQALEIVGFGRDTTSAYAPTSDNLGRVAAGALRLRQRPGANNSLGLVKFLFPNEFNVYLHDTPARSLFTRSERDFSHGCIRVQNPLALAEFALAGQAEWTSEKIVNAMQGTRTFGVRMSRPVTVFVLYATAVAHDGVTYFYNDIYHHDTALERVLSLPIAPGTGAADPKYH